MSRRALTLALLITVGACSRPEVPASEVAGTSTPSPAASVPGVVVVAVKGDWGAGTEAQRAVTARMCAVRRRAGFRTVLTTGDNFYPGGAATPATYFRPERCLYEFPGHRWRAVWGNHDVRSADSTGRVLGARRWYRWSEGGVDFLALDSNRAGDASQRAWLEDALSSSRARVKVAVFHHPPFTTSFHQDNQTVKRSWVPLFERYDVTLVLAGHSHLYEHWVVRGIDYVTTGGGGAVLYECGEQRVALLRCVSAHHFLLVQVDQTEVTVSAITPPGRQLDRFVIDAG